MRKLFFVPIILIILAGSVLAVDSVNYDIIGDKVLVEMNFDSVNDFELRLPFDVDEVVLNTDNYEIIDFDSSSLLKVDSAFDLKIVYFTEAYIDKSGNKFFFVVKNQLVNPADVKLSLPVGAVLDSVEERLIVPEASDIMTDGRKIILIWNEFADDQIVVSYEKIEGISFVSIVFALLVVGFFVYYISMLRFRKGSKKKEKRLTKKGKKSRAKKELTRNLFKEERNIVEYLLDKKKNESWTKNIVKDLDISKVRLSRKLRNLEQKGLIKRIPYGNENIIKLIKKK